MRIALPEGWHALDLADASSIRRSAAALVARQTLSAPVTPAVRRELRELLERVATDARANKAVLLALSLEGMGGVPIPASVTVFERTIPAGLSVIKESIAGDRSAVVAALEGRELVRRTRHRATTPDGAQQAIDQVLVDYWSDGSEPGTVVHCIFSTPLVDLEERMTELFDTMAASILLPV